jgi:hypothetical protein
MGIFQSLASVKLRRGVGRLAANYANEHELIHFLISKKGNFHRRDVKCESAEAREKTHSFIIPRNFKS